MADNHVHFPQICSSIYLFICLRIVWVQTFTLNTQHSRAELLPHNAVDGVRSTSWGTVLKIDWGTEENWQLSAVCTSRDSSLGIVFGLCNSMYNSLFINSKASGPALEPTMPAIIWIQRLLTPDIKWLQRETNHSHSYSAGITYEWSHTSTPHMP